MNSFVVGLIISFVSTFKRLVISWSIKQFGTNCRFLQMGRIDAWDELSLFGIWDELSLGTNWRLGRIVAWDELSLGTNWRLGRIVAWDELSLGTNWRLGRIVAQPSTFRPMPRWHVERRMFLRMYNATVSQSFPYRKAMPKRFC